jgi:uncharacterized protein YdhG (YjbR/CyaY superfamily)
MTEPPTVDAFIAAAPPEHAEILSAVRATLLAALPGAEERVRYGMPAVMLGGRYGLHYQAWKHHLGLYPVGALPDALEAEVAPYRRKKDSVNFTYRDGIPHELVAQIAVALAARHAA